jgi:ribosomal subunit interface protein
VTFQHMKTRFLYKGNTNHDRSNAYIVKKLERLEKHVEETAFFEVELSEEKENTFRVEVMVSVAGELFRAEETTASIEGSIDLVIDELEGQITKKHKRERDLELRGERSLKKKLVVDGDARF